MQSLENARKHREIKLEKQKKVETIWCLNEII